MALRTIRNLTLIALAGTSLSSCALIGGAADGAWTGTKYVAKVVSYPVRAILRDAPEQETQFAEAAAETNTQTTVETTADTRTETVTTTQTAKAPAMDGKVDMMAETVVEVKSSQVMGTQTAAMPMKTDSRWTMKTPQPTVLSASTSETLGSQATAMTAARQTSTSQTSWSSGSSFSQSPVQITDTQSSDVVTVGNVSWIRTEGSGSTEDWRSCDMQSGGFWTFDGASSNGQLNPAFENCMRSISYVRDMQTTASRVAEMTASDMPAKDMPAKRDPLP